VPGIVEIETMHGRLTAGCPLITTVKSNWGFTHSVTV